MIEHRPTRLCALTLVLLIAIPAAKSSALNASAAFRVGANSVQCTREDRTVVRADITVARGRDFMLFQHDYWGTSEGFKPVTIITRLIVVLGQDTVAVPFSAYGDLSAPSQLSLRCGERGAVLTIFGGSSGDEGYTATMVFVGNTLYKRRVQSGLMDEVWEETVYSWIPDDGR